jgi:hypothetical protein
MIRCKAKEIRARRQPLTEFSKRPFDILVGGMSTHAQYLVVVYVAVHHGVQLARYANLPL